jgi:hypothetical protein
MLYELVRTEKKKERGSEGLQELVDMRRGRNKRINARPIDKKVIRDRRFRMTISRVRCLR